MAYQENRPVLSGRSIGQGEEWQTPSHVAGVLLNKLNCTGTEVMGVKTIKPAIGSNPRGNGIISEEELTKGQVVRSKGFRTA